MTASNSPFIKLAIEELSQVWMSDEAVLETAVDMLNKRYATQRAELAAGCPKSKFHASLSLDFVDIRSLHELLPFRMLYWKWGTMTRDSWAMSKDRSETAPTSGHVPISGGRNSHYSKRTINSALRGSERWEKELTWAFEKRARKIRMFLYYQQKTADLLVRYPALDRDKYMSGKPCYEDYAQWIG